MAVASDAEDADFTIIPDWALHWVHAVWNLYRYTGERSDVAELITVVEGVLRWFDPFLDDDGLLRDVFGWVIIDWSWVRTNGASSALNGLYARALVEFAEMAEWLGDAGRADWARTRHGQLADAFEAFLGSGSTPLRRFDRGPVGDRRRRVAHRVGTRPVGRTRRRPRPPRPDRPAGRGPAGPRHPRLGHPLRARRPGRTQQRCRGRRGLPPTRAGRPVVGPRRARRGPALLQLCRARRARRRRSEPT